MNGEKVNIDPVDFKELKKNLFPLMKLMKKINEGKKKGLTSTDNTQSIKKKIEYISNNSDILLNKKFKFLYASLCLLQIQNNSYLNELINANNKKRLRSEEEEKEENENKEKEGGNKEKEGENNNNNNNAVDEETIVTKKARIEPNEEEEGDDVDSNTNNKKKKNKNKKTSKKQKGKEKVVEVENEQDHDSDIETVNNTEIQKEKEKEKEKEKAEYISNDEVLVNIRLRNIRKINKRKKNNPPEVEHIKHLMDVMEFAKYCKQKPFSEEALFPILPLKTTEEDELSLFSRLENITDEKMEDIINTYNTNDKDFYSKCWEDVQKIKDDNEDEDEDEDEDESKYIRKISNNNEREEGEEEEVEGGEEGRVNGKEKGKEINNNEINKGKDGINHSAEEEENENDNDEDSTFSDSDLSDDYTDFIPNQIYRSRIWTDGLMDRFHHLLEKKRNERQLKQKRIKVCSECINRYHNRLQYIACTGGNPCERCKRLGLICYYPFTKKQTSVKRYGNMYRLKENVNNPLSSQEYNERYEMEDELNPLQLNNTIEFRNKSYKKLINDARIIGDREDYFQYKPNLKLGFYLKSAKKDKSLINYLKPFVEDDYRQLEKEQKEVEEHGKIPFLGKTNPKLPTTELLDALHYSVSKRSSLEKQTDAMSFRYDSSALVALGNYIYIYLLIYYYF